METLKDKERATIKDITKTFKTLSKENRLKLYWVSLGMSLTEHGAKNSTNS